MLELEDALQEDDEEKFTVDRLGAKFKWFKKEWRRIDNKIKCGTEPNIYAEFPSMTST